MNRSWRALALAASFSVVVAAHARAGTVFEDLGGRPGLERIVNLLSQSWTSDPRIADAFENVNFDWLKPRLVDHLCQVSGGNCAYHGRPMGAAHKGLHLDTRHFNALVEDLQSAMDKCDVPFSVQNRFLALLAPMYRDVVTR